ncbi:MAG: helix-turn-helix transcriptional regulator [Methanomicrobiales archaeon]|nr:helix-turn-helix transcriptional regulator [Methanomicrobiales archaeon]
MKNRVRVYRAMYNLTQEELAHHLGVTRQTIFAIEKEQYDPSLELAFKIAQLFGAKIEDIFLLPLMVTPLPPSEQDIRKAET